MEIQPGRGVAAARIGETRETVENRLGPPMHPGKVSRAVYDIGRLLVISYTGDDLVELVELPHDAGRGDEAFLDGVQLTWRLLDDVVADLAAKGYRYEQDESSSFLFEAGFVLFSAGSRTPRDLGLDAVENASRSVCEGVSVGPYEYFAAEPTEEQVAAWEREFEAAVAAMDADESMRKFRGLLE
ncbi:hypothetical protein [Actinoplanes derwentensis]|uniref:Uncharacterized protein n=1 Tax=Actinoplanes derwentensis TaxID=113562 RepID=A0A1H1VQZ5_9ACTN|nr:hypothetical protein [Actinoplanes derwentensis]SDS87378.1 hypothetical protein SAMN04489716_1853 [Actinoplanes derwentensis]